MDRSASKQRRRPGRLRTVALLGVSLIAGAAAAAVAPLAACPPADLPLPALRALKGNAWSVAEDGRRQALALGLSACLGAADPELRDDLAFEALATWMRAGKLTAATLQELRLHLLAQLQAEPADAAGFGRPFAVLTLAEIARVDRLHPFLSADERAGLLLAATRYLGSLRDYRGFDAAEGWRHGVAHGADLLLQLALNPRLDATQLQSMLAPIATQVLPAGDHFYIFGEGDRLMAPIFYIGHRKLLGGEIWAAWFAALAERRRAARPALSALAANHDLAGFLLPLYVSVKESGDAELQAQMLPGLLAAMKTLD